MNSKKIIGKLTKSIIINSNRHHRLNTIHLQEVRVACIDTERISEEPECFKTQETTELRVLEHLLSSRTVPVVRGGMSDQRSTIQG